MASKQEEKPPKPRSKGGWRPFVYGGLASCTAEFGTFPIDTAKIRLQIQGQTADKSKASALKYRGMIDVFKIVTKEEGFKALYSGIIPALLRQAIYGTIKIGVYNTLKNYANKGRAKENVAANVLSAVIAGVVSSAIANPTDLLKVRMQAASVKDNVGLVESYKTIYNEEGIKGLWKGVGPNMQRAAVSTAVALPTYDFTKHCFMSILGDTVINHFVSSFIASLGSALASTPIDVVKTRLMNQKNVAEVSVSDAHTAQPIYSGSMDVFTRTVKNEGPLALYKGFIPTWIRMGPWNIIFFMTYEQLKRIY